MLSDKMNGALNGQLNAELYSSYLYLSMSAFFEARDLPGFANWMRVQAGEELVHTMKFFDYIKSCGGRIRLAQVDAPPTEWDSPVKVFEQVYEHERKVTGLIHGLVDLAISERDHATNNFLKWYVDEQVEEEESANSVLQKVRRTDGDRGPGLLYMLDQELGQRGFRFPAGYQILKQAGGRGGE